MSLAPRPAAPLPTFAENQRRAAEHHDRKITQQSRRLPSRLAKGGQGGLYAVTLQIGKGNDLTPAGYPTSLYGIKGSAAVASPIINVPTAEVPASPVDGFYADGLSWGTLLSTGAKVWVSTKLTYDTVDYVGISLALLGPTALASSAAKYSLPALDGGTTLVYLLTGI